MKHKLYPTFFLGNAVKITSVINITTPSTVKITVKNPSAVAVADAVDMTKDADGVYSYILQTSTTWPEGDFVLTVSVTQGVYTAVTQEKFTLVRQEP
jgi:hypothetical protein